MIVVDANVMVMALSSPSTQGDAARAVMLGDDDWIAPAHMPLEVLRTVRKAFLGDRLSTKDADAAFGALTAIQIEYVGTDLALLQAVWAMRTTSRSTTPPASPSRPHTTPRSSPSTPVSPRQPNKQHPTSVSSCSDRTTLELNRSDWRRISASPAD